MEIEGDTNKKPTFTLKKWNAVAVWSWNTNIENCAICKLYLSELCPDCSTDPQSNIRKCKPVWGACNHPFHRHCIAEWLGRRNTCPLCAQEWNEKDENN